MLNIYNLETLERLIKNHNPSVLNLTLVRGLPGSGKTTYAQAYSQIGYNVIDDEVMIDHSKGIYVYDQERVPLQYELDYIKAKASLGKGKQTVVVGLYPTGNTVRNLRKVIYAIDYKALGFKAINYNIITIDRTPDESYTCEIPQKVHDHLKQVFQQIHN